MTDLVEAEDDVTGRMQFWYGGALMRMPPAPVNPDDEKRPLAAE